MQKARGQGHSLFEVTPSPYSRSRPEAEVPPCELPSIPRERGPSAREKNTMFPKDSAPSCPSDSIERLRAALPILLGCWEKQMPSRVWRQCGNRPILTVRVSLGRNRGSRRLWDDPPESRRRARSAHEPAPDIVWKECSTPFCTGPGAYTPRQCSAPGWNRRQGARDPDHRVLREETS